MEDHEQEREDQRGGGLIGVGYNNNNAFIRVATPYCDCWRKRDDEEQPSEARRQKVAIATLAY